MQGLGIDPACPLPEKYLALSARFIPSYIHLPLFCSENSTGLSSDNFECPSRCALPTQMRTPNGKFRFSNSRNPRRVERHNRASEHASFINF